MLGDLKTINYRLLTRRCVGCGYDGALLRGGQAQRCARCGCDLRKRPARSYAEMEGLLGQPMTIEASIGNSRYPERLIHRWLAFLFMLIMGIVALAYLCNEALAV
jgi:hypothetical protein